MTTLVQEDSPLEKFLFDLHISVGATLLVLLVLRICIRLTNRPPPLPDGISPIERSSARLVHAGRRVLHPQRAPRAYGAHAHREVGIRPQIRRRRPAAAQRSPGLGMR